MNKKEGNFIDKTFIVLADLLLKLLPTSMAEKLAFSYYRAGLSYQEDGYYAESMWYYYEALKLEEDPYDRSMIFYNIGCLYSDIGRYTAALKYYRQALELNSNNSQIYNNMAIIYQYKGSRYCEKKEYELADQVFKKAERYWEEAIRLAPNKYLEAQNWLKIRHSKSSLNF